MKISLIVPCYNEEKNIEPFYRLVKKELESKWNNTKLIFVNDGSKDKTQEELEKLHTCDPDHITVLNFSRNFGKESAILAGFEKSQSEFTGIIDADMQQNPKYVKKMLEFLEKNSEYDSVAAYQQKRKENKLLAFFTISFYKIMKWITDIDIVRSASDFRVFRRNVVDAIISLPERCRFSKGIFSWVGFNTYYMPYEVDHRIHGESKWSFWKLCLYAVDGIVAFSTKPLIISAVIGLIFFLCSMLFGLSIIVKTLFFGDPVPGFPTLATVILFASGIQLFFLGVVGQYLSKDYIENKARPHYIIKSKFEKEV